MELNQYKAKELTFKKYKEELKNSQWEVEREVKKCSQVFLQKVVLCFPEAKDKLQDPIKHFEQAMSNAINFKI